MTSTDSITISGITFTRGTVGNLEFHARTMADLEELVASDLAALRNGDRTADSLLEHCLDGANDSDVQDWVDYVDALVDHVGGRGRTRYEVRGSASIRSSDDHPTLDAARWAVLRQNKQGEPLVAVEWDDGSIAYYATQEDADADDTGEGGLAIVTKMER